ncbi:UL16-binding protein 1-like [Choloepus didactylus]|uniref:UL16-binding protein 1-like n=1 Tax=Choloepus didactylus TaxID=27675 RepID=UPI0018A0415F|nr:UL16-binding protein 1-like [Choloepus didactylus]
MELLCYLLMLLLGGFRAASGDIHSLSYSFTVISKSGPGQPRCEVRGSVDKKPFLYYECGSCKAEPLGPLGERVNSTEVWAELPETLNDVEQELRSTLQGIKLEQNKTRGAHPPTLEAQMSCQHEADECREASWQFSIDGQTFLIFDSIHTKWTVVHPGAGIVKEKWKSDQVLAQYLRKVSKGDCSHWLREFLKYWEKMPELAVTPTVTLEIPQPPGVQLLSWLIPVILFCVFLIFLTVFIKYLWSGSCGSCSIPGCGFSEPQGTQHI